VYADQEHVYAYGVKLYKILSDSVEELDAPLNVDSMDTYCDGSGCRYMSVLSEPYPDVYILALYADDRKEAEVTLNMHPYYMHGLSGPVAGPGYATVWFFNNDNKMELRILRRDGSVDSVVLPTPAGGLAADMFGAGVIGGRVLASDGAAVYVIDPDSGTIVSGFRPEGIPIKLLCRGSRCAIGTAIDAGESVEYTTLLVDGGKVAASLSGEPLSLGWDSLYLHSGSELQLVDLAGRSEQTLTDRCPSTTFPAVKTGGDAVYCASVGTLYWNYLP